MMLRASPTILTVIDDDTSSPDVSSSIKAAPHVPLKTYRTKDRAKDIDIDKFIMASGGTRNRTTTSSDDDPAVSDIDDIDDDGDGDDVPMVMTESQPLPTDRKVSRISDHKIDGDAEDAEYEDNYNFYSNVKHHHDGYVNHQNSSKRYNNSSLINSSSVMGLNITTVSDRIVDIGQQRGHQHHQPVNISKSGRQPVQDLPAVLQKSESMDTSIGWKRSDGNSSEVVTEGDMEVVYDEASNDGDKSRAYNTTTKQSEVTQRNTDKVRISSGIVSRIPLTNSHIRFDREDSNLLVLDNGDTTTLDNNNNMNNSNDEGIRKKRKIKSKEVNTHRDDSLDINSSNNNAMNNSNNNNNYYQTSNNHAIAPDYFSVDHSRRSASPEDDGNNNNKNSNYNYNNNTTTTRSNSNAYSQSVEKRTMLTSLKKEDVFDLTEDDP
jgi:hypothetical protein